MKDNGYWWERWRRRRTMSAVMHPFDCTECQKSHHSGCDDDDDDAVVHRGRPQSLWHIKIEMDFFELQFSFPFCFGATRASLLAHCLMFVRRNINSKIRPEGELWCEASGQEIKLLMCGLQRQYIVCDVYVPAHRWWYIVVAVNYSLHYAQCTDATSEYGGKSIEKKFGNKSKNMSNSIRFRF